LRLLANWQTKGDPFDEHFLKYKTKLKYFFLTKLKLLSFFLINGSTFRNKKIKVKLVKKIKKIGEVIFGQYNLENKMRFIRLAWRV
jgi:hypothetical protein